MSAKITPARAPTFAATALIDVHLWVPEKSKIQPHDVLNIYAGSNGGTAACRQGAVVSATNENQEIRQESGIFQMSRW